MSKIRITDAMWFLTDRRGGMLHFHFSAPGEKVMDAFEVGMSHTSLKDCRKALDSDRVFWTNKDKSLAVKGTRDETTLSFALQGPPFGHRNITISGPALVAFRSTLESLGGK